MDEMLQALADELKKKAKVSTSEKNGLLTIKISWGNETRKLVLKETDDFDTVFNWATIVKQEIDG